MIGSKDLYLLWTTICQVQYEFTAWNSEELQNNPRFLSNYPYIHSRYTNKRFTKYILLLILPFYISILPILGIGVNLFHFLKIAFQFKNSDNIPRGKQNIVFCFGNMANIRNINNFADFKHIGLKNLNSELSGNYLNIYNTATILDKLKGLIITFSIVIYLSLTLKFKTWPYNLKLFEWVLVSNLISRIKYHNIVITNHYDRWAFLCDRLQGEITIVQHGRLERRRKGGLYFFKPTIKLKNISRIYYIHQDQLRFFSYFVQPHNVRETLIVPQFLSLLNENSNTSKSIMVIGPGTKLKVELAEALLCRIVINIPNISKIYVRPHPRQKFSDSIVAQKWFECCNRSDEILNVAGYLDFGSTFSLYLSQIIDNKRIIDIDLFDEEEVNNQIKIISNLVND